MGAAGRRRAPPTGRGTVSGMDHPDQIRPTVPLTTPALRAPAPMLSAALWATVQDSVPILCVDIVPVRRDPEGNVTDVGFIRRAAPFGDEPVWCHVGGRANLGESLAEAITRHLTETLGAHAGVDVGSDPQPHYVMQYFRQARLGDSLRSGWDPRKHAVALTFVIELPAGVTAVRGGEGTEFRWIPIELLATMTDTWPGSMTAVLAALTNDSHCRIAAA